MKNQNNKAKSIYTELDTLFLKDYLKEHQACEWSDRVEQLRMK